MIGSGESSPVIFLRWPAEAALRSCYSDLGIPRLLVVEGGAQPPAISDIQEDWVRAPISHDDLQARIAALRARCDAYTRPLVDPHGVVRFGGRSTTLSPTATDLLGCLVRKFGTLVDREALYECLPEGNSSCIRNALDLHIMRLRKRIRPVGLVIQTVWGHGYLLEPAVPSNGAAPAPGPLSDPGAYRAPWR